MRKNIELKQADFFELNAPSSNGVIVMNPPYGERLAIAGNMDEFFGRIGTALKHHFPGWEAWIISSDIESFKHIGLKAAKKISLFNGKLACQFRKYELFSGKRNIHKSLS